MATGDNLKSTKAYVAAALGFVGPGALYLISVGDDGLTGNEWLLGALYCLAAGAATGLAVQQIENKPKEGP
jgi:hypothetical protein